MNLSTSTGWRQTLNDFYLSTGLTAFSPNEKVWKLVPDMYYFSLPLEFWELLLWWLNRGNCYFGIIWPAVNNWITPKMCTCLVHMGLSFWLPVSHFPLVSLKKYIVAKTEVVCTTTKTLHPPQTSEQSAQQPARSLLPVWDGLFFLLVWLSSIGKNTPSSLSATTRPSARGMMGRLLRFLKTESASS